MSENQSTVITNNTAGEEIIKPPATGEEFNKFLEFVKTPTTHDGKPAASAANLDFDDIDPNEANKGAFVKSGTNTQPPATNAASVQNSAQITPPTQQAQQQVIRSDAKALVKGFDFLHGFLISYVGELTAQEEAERKFRAKERELNEIIQMLSDVLNEDGVKPISPKWILLLMFLTVYVERTISAVKDKKAKQAKRKQLQKLANEYENLNANEFIQPPATEQQPKEKKRSNGLLGKKRGSYNKKK